MTVDLRQPQSDSVQAVHVVWIHWAEGWVTSPAGQGERGRNFTMLLRMTCTLKTCGLFVSGIFHSMFSDYWNPCNWNCRQWGMTSQKDDEQAGVREKGSVWEESRSRRRRMAEEKNQKAVGSGQTRNKTRTVHFPAVPLSKLVDSTLPKIRCSNALSVGHVLSDARDRPERWNRDYSSILQMGNSSHGSPQAGRQPMVAWPLHSLALCHVTPGPRCELNPKIQIFFLSLHIF